MSEARPSTFDARPLTEPVDRRQVTDFLRAMRATNPITTQSIITWVFIGVVAVLVIGGVLATATMVFVISSQVSTVEPVAFWPVLLLLAVAALIGAFAVVRLRLARIERYRLARFAAANNMVYLDQVDDPPLPGMIFDRGSRRRSTSLVRGYEPRFVEFANYQYTVSSGEDSKTHHWGYVAVKLDVPLPNIVLDAVGNNGLGGNLPSSFAKDQRLSLEGDFDNFFRLYCPSGYEADALYLFTPDIMARFIDHAAELDVEIVDDWMFLYAQRPVSTTDPATWEWLFGVVGALMTKFDQWARWRDERMPTTPAPANPVPTAAGGASALPFAAPTAPLTPPPGVAPPGRRLKRSVSWPALIVFGVVVAVMVTNFFSMFG